MDKKWRDFLKKTKLDYTGIGQISCPAFDDEKVYFTQAGFRHCIRKSGEVRPLDEQKRRFELIPNAVEMLKDSRVPVTYFKNNKDNSEIHYWSFKEGTITVVIRQVNKGPKHFYSVFDE